MKICKPFFILFVLIALPAGLQAKQEGKPISENFGYEYSLDSKIMSENRKYLLHLPESYQESEKGYPVIYTLDGPSHFRHIVSAMKVLQTNDRMPEAIVVGIPNNPGTRFRDLSQKNDQFLNFVENELVPLIDSQYRTNPTNTLFGHSLAGYFTFHAMTNGTRFTNFIAASPHIVANITQIESSLKALIKNDKHKGKSLYFTMADAQGDGIERVQSVETLSKMLKEQTTKSLAWKYQPIDQQEHMTTPYLTAFKGLTFVFTDYQMPMFNDSEDYLAKGGMKAVEKHFLARAKKYNSDSKVSQRMIGHIASLYADEKNMGEAIRLLSDSVKKNPDSMRAHFDLARAYHENGEKSFAIKEYGEALERLNPEQDGFGRFIKQQVERLKTSE
jgi:predicted alpha/beta superfamily hydrolase